MAIKNIISVIQLRNGPQSAWEKVADKYIPKVGEACVVTEGENKGQVKFGDGVSTWGALPYSGSVSVDNKTIVTVNGTIELAGFVDAEIGSQLTKGEDGNIVWAKPTVPIATEEIIGGIKSATEDSLNKVVVDNEGYGEVKKVDMAVLEPNEEVMWILDGGGAPTSDGN